MGNVNLKEKSWTQKTAALNVTKIAAKDKEKLKLHTKIAHKNCTQKLHTKIAHKNCTQKLFTKIVHKNCTQKLHTKIAS